MEAVVGVVAEFLDVRESVVTGCVVFEDFGYFGDTLIGGDGVGLVGLVDVLGALDVFLKSVEEIGPQIGVVLDAGGVGFPLAA